MRYAILVLIVAGLASSSSAQDVSPEAAAATYVEPERAPEAPPCRVPKKAGPIAGTVLGPSFFLGGALLASGGSINVGGGDYSRGERAMRGTGFAMMTTGLAATIVSSIYLHRARRGICTRKQ